MLAVSSRLLCYILIKKRIKRDKLFRLPGRRHEDGLVFLDVMLQHAPLVLPALGHQLQVGLQLGAQVRLGHLVAHGVVTCGGTNCVTRAAAADLLALKRVDVSA